MAATLAFKDSTAARGAEDYATMSSFKPGRTVAVYVNGNYAGVKATGPHDTQPTWGAVAGQIQMPVNNPAGAQKACAVDMTDGTTTAAVSITLT
jgi:hypothetical protein